MKPKFKEYQKVRIKETKQIGTIVDVSKTKNEEPFYCLELLIDSNYEVFDFLEEELEEILIG